MNLDLLTSKFIDSLHVEFRVAIVLHRPKYLDTARCRSRFFLVNHLVIIRGWNHLHQLKVFPSERTKDAPRGGVNRRF